MPALSSPLLDQYNRDGIVTPGLQRALDITRQRMPQFQPQLQFQQTEPAARPALMPPTPVPTLSRATAAPETPGIATPAAAPTPAPSPATPLVVPQGDPNAAAHLSERNRLISTGSGISQVKNPLARGLLRGLDVFGSAFLPGITAGIPGTELHHNYLVKRAENAVSNDVTRAHTNAQTAETEARTAAMPGEEALHEAQMRETNARTANLENPPDKQGDPTKTLETAEGIRQWNPETGRYDIPVGQAPGKEQQNVHVLPDGSVVAVHHDPKTGKSSAEVLYKGDPRVQGHVIQRQVGGKLHNMLVNSQTGEDIKDLGETRQPNAGADHGVTLIGPDNTILRLQPGQKAPEGAMTPTQAGTMNVPTAATRTMAEKAPRVLNFVDRIEQLLNENEKQLGPLKGRWSEFETGKVGLKNMGYTQLRTDLGLLHTALMNMHVGARGGEKIMEHFQHMIDGGYSDPDNLRAALGEIKMYAQEVAKENKRGAGEAAGGGAGGGQIPTVKSKAEYDALPKGAVYMEDGKKYKKP